MINPRLYISTQNMFFATFDVQGPPNFIDKYIITHIIGMRDIGVNLLFI